MIIAITVAVNFFSDMIIEFFIIVNLVVDIFFFIIGKCPNLCEHCNCALTSIIGSIFLYVNNFNQMSFVKNNFLNPSHFIDLKFKKIFTQLIYF